MKKFVSITRIEKLIIGTLRLNPLSLIFFSLFFFFLFGCRMQQARFHFPDQGWNPHSLHWKHGVSTTGPPGKSQPTLIWFLKRCQQIVSWQTGLHTPWAREMGYSRLVWARELTCKVCIGWSQEKITDPAHENLESLYICPLISTGDWFQDLLQTQKSEDA